MAVFKVNKTEDYTVMANSHFRNHKMSLKAKGLLSLMLSLPDDWDYSLEGLAALCSDGLSSVKTTLKELEQCGYVEVVKMMPGTTKSGRIEYEYNIYEIPKQEYEKQEVEILPLEILPLEIQPTENRRQLNTNKLNTNKLNTNNRAFRPPAVEDVSEYCLERNNGIDPSEFVDFYASKGWMVGKSKMKDWKAAVRNWERRRASEKPKQSKVLSLEELEAIENGKRT